MITLESIKAKQDEITQLISSYENQSAAVEYIFPETEIRLSKGEHYAGLILGEDRESSYHLILLPNEKHDINWSDAVTWAKEQGGDIPTRREQALLYANLKEQFEERWYWSSEQHASNSDFAWSQNFDYGTQDTNHKNDELRARAVRRLLVIQ